MAASQSGKRWTFCLFFANGSFTVVRLPGDFLPSVTTELSWLLGACVFSTVGSGNISVVCAVDNVKDIIWDAGRCLAGMFARWWDVQDASLPARILPKMLCPLLGPGLGAVLGFLPRSSSLLVTFLLFPRCLFLACNLISWSKCSSEFLKHRGQGGKIACQCFRNCTLTLDGWFSWVWNRAWAPFVLLLMSLRILSPFLWSCIFFCSEGLWFSSLFISAF